MGRKLSQSSVHTIKLAYMDHLKEKRGNSSDYEVTELPSKKRGRPLLLGEIDKQLQLYLRKIRDQGGIVTASVVVVAARGIYVV